MASKIAAFKASFPALFGYIALGLSFGFLFQKAGGSWYLATLMSILVYAGAAQFVAITLLLNHSGLLPILSATLFINLRHIFYGLSFLDRFPNKFFKKIYMIFGLTDEAYSILSAQKIVGIVKSEVRHSLT
ncbi:MAG: AzlC family ABC transporter permease [Gammaproteobacteria bacterium]|nr:AzlC family ABC transporter permease [Gammaproteobacteria bacterium]